MELLARQSLADPRTLVIETLPDRLSRYGYHDGLSRADMTIADQKALFVTLS